MHFESRFVVSGTPEALIERFADVPLMASFLPGASVGVPAEDGAYPATLMASFGPKKIAFRGTLTQRVDRESLSGVLTGQASADVRGARMAVTMNYRLAPADASRTEVRLDSQAQLTGVLAEFAKAGGAIVAEALIAEFARNFSAHMEAEAARTAGKAGAVDAAPAAPAARAAQRPATLSVTVLLGALLQWLKNKVWRTA